MKFLIAPLLTAVTLLATPVWADLSRDDAAAVAQRVSRGRVLSVDPAQAGGRPAWRGKVVTAQGEGRGILIDAASGQAM